MGWTCQLLEGLEELSFKFERCGGTFKRMKIINRTSSRALEDLERSNWALNEEKLEENGLGGDWIRSGLVGYALEAQNLKGAHVRYHPRSSTRVAQGPAGAISEILLLSYLRKVGAHLLETLGHPIFGDSLWSFEDF